MFGTDCCIVRDSCSNDVFLDHYLLHYTGKKGMLLMDSDRVMKQQANYLVEVAIGL